MESAKRSLSARIRENGFRKQLKQDARGGKQERGRIETGSRIVID